KLAKAAQPRYQLEVGLVKLMEMRRLQSLNQIVERVAALEESLRTGKPPAQTQTPSPAAGGSPGLGPRSSRAVSSSSPRASSASGTAAKLAIDTNAQLESSSAVESAAIIGVKETPSADPVGNHKQVA